MSSQDQGSEETFSTPAAAAAAWVASKGTLRELSSHQTRERKRLKRVETALLALMRASGMERIEADGRTIVLKYNLADE